MEQIAKLHPQNIEAEETVLGTILQYEKSLELVQDMLTSELFYRDDHREVAAAIIRLGSKSLAIDTISVMSELKKVDKLKFIGGGAFLAVLSNKGKTPNFLENHVRLLQEAATKRSVINIGSQFVEKGFDPTNDVFDLIDTVEKEITDLTRKIITSKIVDSGELAVLTDKKNKIIRDSGGVPGISTGFIDFDKKVGGWQKTDLIIIAARPGMGKTALATQLLSHPAIRFRQPTAFFSLEMSNEQLYMRMKSQISGIELYKFTKYGLNQVEVDSCDISCKGLYHAPIYFDDTGGITIFDLKNKARKLKREKGIEVLIIDYLQLIRVKDHRGNREQEISTISRELKALAKELEITVICLSQLSREVEKRGGAKIPVLSDLRESGAIEQDADVIVFIYRPEYYGITEDGAGNQFTGKAQLIVAKNRHGSTGDVVLGWSGQHTRFSDINTVNFEEPLPPLAANNEFDKPNF